MTITSWQGPFSAAYWPELESSGFEQEAEYGDSLEDVRRRALNTLERGEYCYAILYTWDHDSWLEVEHLCLNRPALPIQPRLSA